MGTNLTVTAARLLIKMYDSGFKIFLPDQLFKVIEIKQLCYFSIQSPFNMWK